MKKFFLTFFSFLAISLIFSSFTKVFPKKAIDMTIVSDEGCKIHIVGTVHFSIVPPQITDFTGSISISGGGKCPKSTMTFRKSNERESDTKSISLIFDNDDFNKLTKIECVGEREFSNILNQEKVNSVLVEELKKYCNTEY